MKRPLQTLLFACATLAVVAFGAMLLQRFDSGIQIGGAARLSAASLRLLQGLEAPLRITSYAPDNAALRKRIRAVLRPYLRASRRIGFGFVNPDAEPRRARAAGIRAHGELVLDYQGRSEHLVNLDEPSISRAIARLLQERPRWLVALNGHGERRFSGNANLGLSRIGTALKQSGYRLVELDAARIAAIPDNTGVLLLADPEQALDAHARGLVLRHLARGGDLLVLDDSQDASRPLDFLERRLGLRPVPGWIYDPEPPMRMPATTLIAVEPDRQQRVTRGLEQPLLLVEASAFRAEDAGWRATPLLHPGAKSWSESSPPDSQAESFDLLAGDSPGPLIAGWALERGIDGRSQRVILIGDADFAANRFVGNGANQDFLVEAVRWLSHDAWLGGDFTAPERTLRLNEGQMLTIGFGSLFVLPALLLAAGLGIRWWRRRA